MKKNTRNLQKKIEIKSELERISNKTLLIFTISLISEIILLFLYSAFQGVGSYIAKIQGFVTTIAVLGFIAFVSLLVSGLIIKNKKGASLLTKRLIDWSIASLAISFAAFIIYPIDIVTSLFSLIGLANKGGVLAMKMSVIAGSKATLAVIIGVAVYVIVMFVYYGIRTKKIKNSK